MPSQIVSAILLINSLMIGSMQLKDFYTNFKVLLY